MNKKIVGILVMTLLIGACVLPLMGTMTASKVFLMDDITKGETFKDIEEIDDKVLSVDEIIGDTHVMYWEHVINEVYVKGDSILIHIDIETGDIVNYEKTWTDIEIESASIDDIFKPDNYFWKQKVVFPDEYDCTYFYTFYEPQEYPLVCLEVRHVDGTTIMYSFDGTQIGQGIPAPQVHNGFSLSGYDQPSSPDPWIQYRQNADSWFTKWCVSTVSLSTPTPATISSYVSNPNYGYFYELAHGDSYFFQADFTGSYYYAANLVGFNVKTDMTSRSPMKFAFIGSCDGMKFTTPGTFSYEFRKSQVVNTVVVGYSGMATCPGWSVAWPWQDYMFSQMDAGNTIKTSFDLACNQYPTIAACVVFNGDINLIVDLPPSNPIIKGPNSGNAGNSYPYTFSSTDPNGDQVSYFIDWNDGTTSGWTPFQASGTVYSESHTWSSPGTYLIKAQAKDTNGAVSGITTFSVTMPRSRAMNRPLLNFLENHPNLFPVLQLLLQRLGL